MLKISKTLELPPDVAVQTSAILGIRGSGKTNTGVVVTEELLKLGSQVIIIDPTDVWWGLKSSKDGKRAGFPIVVLGGPHGDLPLAGENGQLVADFVVENRASVILSLRHLRKGAQKQFVTAFAEQLYFRKGEAKHRTPVMVVMDECDAFIPQKVGGAEARMVGAIEDLVRRGRAAGLGMLLISQRAASINKDVLTQIELLVAHRHTSPQDRAALKLWIEAHDTGDRQDEFMHSIASLDRGQAWFWSPGWLDLFDKVLVRERSTFDSSKTPEAGDQVALPTKLAAVDLAKLQEKLKVLIEEAKGNDLKLLKAQIAELQRDLAALKKAAPAETIKTVEVPVYTDKDHKCLDAVTVRYENASAKCTDAARDLADVYSRLLQAIYSVRKAPTAAPLKPAPPPARSPNPAPLQQRPAEPVAADGEKLKPASLGFLSAFYWLKDETATPAKAAFYAGYSIDSSTSERALADLRKRGLVDGWRITAAGEQLVASYICPKPSGRELREVLRSNLGPCPNKMLDALIVVHPDRLNDEQLGQAAGYSPGSSTYERGIAQLRKIEAAEGTSKQGGVKAADVFLE